MGASYHIVQSTYLTTLHQAKHNSPCRSKLTPTDQPVPAPPLPELHLQAARPSARALRRTQLFSPSSSSSVVSLRLPPTSCPTSGPLLPPRRSSHPSADLGMPTALPTARCTSTGTCERMARSSTPSPPLRTRPSLSAEISTGSASSPPRSALPSRSSKRCSLPS